MTTEKSGTSRVGALHTPPALRGAEAVLARVSFLGRDGVRKDRIAKTYRERELDVKLRTRRTRAEAKLLSRAKNAGVKCPIVLRVEEFAVTMTKLPGKRMDEWLEAGGTARKIKGKANSSKADLSIRTRVLKSSGELLARLHSVSVVHGDYTPANLFVEDEKKGLVSVFDFGLGAVSLDREDYAVDVLTMQKALGNPQDEKHFFSGYASVCGEKKAEKLAAHVQEIKERGRYQ